ncbi:MAG: nitroreductase [Lachnospiraceae bacterium]|nr:nitroreductase [Lachnospiraceae bacterium]
MSDILEIMKSRRSIRSFKKDMVPKELIEQIMEAGTYAASGRNAQVPIIIAVTNPEKCDALRKVNAKFMGQSEDFDPFYGAPVILIVIALKERPTYVCDGSLTLGNMMLAAHELGLGSCWIHRAKEEFELPEWKEFAKSLGIEGEFEGVGHLALGYIDGEYPAAPPRKPGRTYFVD